jgi:hypothetical protein
MFITHNAESKLGPIQKLKAAQDTPLEQFSILVSAGEIEELTTYTKEIIYDPAKIRGQIKKLLLLHVAAIRFIILAFEDEDYLGEELVINCEKLAKTLYLFYKDINILLISREMAFLWKHYMKLADLIPRVPEESSRKVDSSRDRLLSRLQIIEVRVKAL